MIIIDKRKIRSRVIPYRQRSSLIRRFVRLCDGSRLRLLPVRRRQENGSLFEMRRSIRQILYNLVYLNELWDYFILVRLFKVRSFVAP
jgi:hypothetical protein